MKKLTIKESYLLLKLFLLYTRSRGLAKYRAKRAILKSIADPLSFKSERELFEEAWQVFFVKSLNAIDKAVKENKKETPGVLDDFLITLSVRWGKSVKEIEETVYIEDLAALGLEMHRQNVDRFIHQIEAAAMTLSPKAALDHVEKLRLIRDPEEEVIDLAKIDFSGAQEYIAKKKNELKNRYKDI